MRVPADFDATRAIQWEASDPAASAWVVANAGAGKTHVLTQRVIRLLLAGADPAAILCLTFTKVAAAEMTRRIFGTLGQWATLPDAELSRAVLDVQGRPATRAELSRARRLFARALETPGGLKIQTIHAFCERLLHQFPFEANVPGQFAILDDTAAAALLGSARAEVMEKAVRDPQARLGRAMRFLAEHATDMQIGAGLDAVVAEREAIRRWIVMSASGSDFGGLDDALADLRDAFAPRTRRYGRGALRRDLRGGGLEPLGLRSRLPICWRVRRTATIAMRTLRFALSSRRPNLSRRRPRGSPSS